MHGPWYTFEEAQELLKCNRSELLHHIDEQAIQPVVSTKQRTFLIFTRNAQREWLGLGTCSYRGCLTLHRNCIASLIENGELRLGTGSGRLLEPHKASNWNTRYPFKQQPPYSAISSWLGRDLEGLDITKLAATPLPEEKPSSAATVSKVMTGFGQFIETLAAKNKSISTEKLISEDPELQELQNKAETNPWALNFSLNSLFRVEDLRIPASEVDKFLNPTPEQESQKQLEVPKLKRERTNQLHELFVRAMAANPDANSGQLWKLIKADYQTDEPTYDTEGIIERMDSDGIDWISRGEAERHCSRRSFPAILSKLRKEITNN